MKWVSYLLAVTVLLSTYAQGAEPEYEVYYFHASWRCSNCTNAEAWAGQAVDMLKADNPNARIAYVPKQLETNADLVKSTGAKRVDLVVAEVQDGKIIRHKNVGNLLDVIESKALVKKTIIDGIMDFNKDAKEPSTISLPNEYAKLEERIENPRKVGVFIVAKNAAASPQPAVVEVVSAVLEKDYTPQLMEQSIIASLVDPENEQTRDFANELGAKDGEVVITSRTRQRQPHPGHGGDQLPHHAGTIRRSGRFSPWRRRVAGAVAGAGAVHPHLCGLASGLRVFLPQMDYRDQG